jgi:hypothetical protein
LKSYGWRQVSGRWFIDVSSEGDIGGIAHFCYLIPGMINEYQPSLSGVVDERRMECIRCGAEPKKNERMIMRLLML